MMKGCPAEEQSRKTAEPLRRQLQQIRPLLENARQTAGQTPGRTSASKAIVIQDLDDGPKVVPVQQ